MRTLAGALSNRDDGTMGGYGSRSAMAHECLSRGRNISLDVGRSQHRVLREGKAGLAFQRCGGGSVLGTLGGSPLWCKAIGDLTHGDPVVDHPDIAPRLLNFDHGETESVQRLEPQCQFIQR